MAENKQVQSFDQLNQQELGDKKLSKAEISYIASKDQLWFKDIGDRLYNDIVATNVTSLSKPGSETYMFMSELTKSQSLVEQIFGKLGVSSNALVQMGGVNRYGNIFAKKSQTEQNIMLINALLAKSNAYPEGKAQIQKNILTATFGDTSVKALHRFQKNGEKLQGWSKADCIIGKKTIQQLLAAVGVTTQLHAVDTKFAKSRVAEQSKYESNSAQQKQMNSIVADPMLNEQQKASALIDVMNKTSEVGADGLNKKYGAVSYMMSLLQKNVLPGLAAEEKLAIIALLQPHRDTIAKYWNEKATDMYVADAAVNASIKQSIVKTKDFVADLSNGAEAREKEVTGNREMLKVALTIARAREVYYNKENTRSIYEKRKQNIQEGIAMLQGQSEKSSRGALQLNIQKALGKVFNIGYRDDFSSDEKNRASQQEKIGLLFAKNYGDWNSVETQRYVLSEALSAIRTIDENFDGDLHLGRELKLGSNNSTDGITSAVEGEQLYNLRIEGASAEAFNKQRDIVKTGIDAISNEIINNPKGAKVQQFDEVVAAFGNTKSIAKETRHKDADGGYVTNTEYTTVIDASVEAKLQNLFPGLVISKETIGLLNDSLANSKASAERQRKETQRQTEIIYTRMYNDMNGKIAWLREQGQSQAADSLEANKAGLDSFLHGGKLDGMAGALDMYNGMTLTELVNVSVHDAARMGFLNTMGNTMMQGVMKQHENALKALRNKAGTSDENLLRLYADVKGYDGSWSDATINTVSIVATEVIIMIVVSILTAGIGGVLLDVVLQAAKLGLEAARFTRAAALIARFGKLGHTAYRDMKAAGTITKGVRAAKLGYRGTALLLEAPMFNSASKAIHNVLAGGELLEGMSFEDLNPTSRENIKTAAFLGVLHGFSILKGGVVNVNFAEGAKQFTKTQEFLVKAGKDAKMLGGEIVSMMAAEQTINLTFGVDQIDPITGEQKVVHSLVPPTPESLAQMVGMILGMRASAKFNIWPKIEAKLKTGEFVMMEAKNAKGSIDIADAKTGKKYSLMEVLTGKKALDILVNKNAAKGNVDAVASVKKTVETLEAPKKNIDKQFNNYADNAVANKNHMKRQERQNTFELELLQAQQLMRMEEVAPFLSEGMKKILNAGDIRELSSANIKQLQREIGAKQDGILGPLTLNRLSSHFDSKLSGVKNHVNTPEEAPSQTRFNLSKEIQDKPTYDLFSPSIEAGKKVLMVDGQGVEYVVYKEGDKYFAAESNGASARVEMTRAKLEEHFKQLDALVKDIETAAAEQPADGTSVVEVQKTISLLTKISTVLQAGFAYPKSFIMKLKTRLDTYIVNRASTIDALLKDGLGKKKITDIRAQLDVLTKAPQEAKDATGKQILRELFEQSVTVEKYVSEKVVDAEMEKKQIDALDGLYATLMAVNTMPSRSLAAMKSAMNKSYKKLVAMKNTVVEAMKPHLARLIQKYEAILALFQTIAAPKPGAVDQNVTTLKDAIKEATSIDELQKGVEDQGGVDGYTQGAKQPNGKVTPSGDKEFIQAPEIVEALKDGNFETVNFQKGEPMLALRAKGVEFYVNEKIGSLEDMIFFVAKNPKLFGGGLTQQSLLVELQKPGKTDGQKREAFNKKVQKSIGISGAGSKTGFDLKKVIDSTVKKMLEESSEAASKVISEQIEGALQGNEVLAVSNDLTVTQVEGNRQIIMEKIRRLIHLEKTINERHDISVENKQSMLKAIHAKSIPLQEALGEYNKLKFSLPNKQLAARCTTLDALRTELLSQSNTTMYGSEQVPMTGQELYSRIQHCVDGTLALKYLPAELRSVVEAIKQNKPKPRNPLHEMWDASSAQ